MRLLHKLSAYTPLIMWCIDVFLSVVSTAFAIIVIHAVLRLPIQAYLIFPLLGISLVASVFGTWLFHTFRGVISRVPISPSTISSEHSWQLSQCWTCFPLPSL